MPVTEETYERLALEDLEGQWELVCGRPRQKPGMTQEHNYIARKLTKRIGSQVDEAEFDVSANSARLRIANGNTFIPDVAVVQISLMPGLRGTGRLKPIATRCHSSPKFGRPPRVATTLMPSSASTSSGRIARSGASTRTANH
jgi:hypothetical protein